MADGGSTASSAFGVRPEETRLSLVNYFWLIEDRPMKTFWIMTAALAMNLFAALPGAAQYSARRDGDIVHLEDKRNQTVVSIITSVGNVAYEMKVKDQNVLYFPAGTPEAYKGGLSGIPFLGPWANRLDQPAFFANGKRYTFNPDLGNVRGNHPIHGFLSSASQWQVTEVNSNDHEAWVTSHLDFYKQPDWMAQFPFAHAIDMTYRLRDGVLEVNLKIHNLSAEAMPISVGFHPYYRLTDSPRDDWMVSIGARTQWILNADKIPTGETQPIEKFFPEPEHIRLRDYSLDHVFADLIRDANGRATMSVRGKTQRLDISFGPRYRAAVVYSPGANPQSIPAERGGLASATPPQGMANSGRGGGAANGGAGRGGGRGDPNFIALEPMAGITDAMNLAEKGLYKELQTLAPGETWSESFWIRPSGF
jgi:aldose 1-epimerase